MTQLDTLHSLDLVALIQEAFVALRAVFSTQNNGQIDIFLAKAGFVLQVAIAKFSTISFFIAMLLLLGCLYVAYRLNELHEQNKALAKSLLEEEVAEKQTVKKPRWEKAVAHSLSTNTSDWRLAIMEADILLDELLESLGYRGDSIGEKMKQVEKGDFKSLDAAWEAHKVRNTIAHEGGDFILTERETRRVMELFKQVFNEFKFI